MECPICLLSERGAYLFTECGHSACPQCIIRMHETAHTLKCPMCRITINRAPIIIQAFASHMPDGLVHTMTQNFANWFGDNNEKQSNSISLQSSYPAHQILNDLMDTFSTHSTNIINTIESYENVNNNNNINTQNNLNTEVQLINAAREEFNLITSEYTRNNVPLKVISLVHDLPNDWTFIPFNKAVKMNVLTDFSERWNTGSRNKYRRVVLYMNYNSFRDQIIDTEHLVFSSFRNQNLVPFSEIGTRNNRLSICAHSLTDDSNKTSTNSLRNLTLVCRGAWKHNGRIGCRWYVAGLY